MKRSAPPPDCAPADEPTRSRILNAAFDVLQELGYGATNTRAIAARAKVSKRELYREFGSKQGIYAALIASRSTRMRQPLDGAGVTDRDAFATTLERVGVAFLTQLCDPAVVSLFRLAIAAAEQSPEMAQILDDNGRQPNRRALIQLMAAARETDVVTGDPAALAARFLALLLGEIYMPVLLGVAASPTRPELERHARDVAGAFLALHGRTPGSRAPRT